MSVMLPFSREVHRELDLEFVELPKLSEKLKGQSFQGYLVFAMPPGWGVWVFVAGQRGNAYFEGTGQRLRGTEAAKELDRHLRAKTGKVSLYECDEGALAALGTRLFGQSVHGELRAEFIRVPDLLQDLQERVFSGVVGLAAEDETAYLYLTGGALARAYCAEASVPPAAKGSGAASEPLPAAVRRLADKPETAIEVWAALESPREVLAQVAVPEARQRSVLLLVRMVEGGRTFYEDAQGKRYRREELAKLWEEHHLAIH